MQSSTYVLGLDISTTASKALLIDRLGTVVGHASSAHEVHAPKPLWSEQDPGAWWQAMAQSIHTVLSATRTDPGSVQAIGLTGQMHGLVMLDESGEVLRPAMLWNDGRSGAQCTAIRKRLGLERLVAITGNDAYAGFTAPKLLWVKENEPDVYRRAAQILLPKDYIRYRLTGEYATDCAGAGGTLMLDLARRDWSDEIVGALGIPSDWLSPTHEGTTVTGHVSTGAAELTGLQAGTPVVAGGGDQATQAVGVGAIHPETWAVTLGTSGVVFAPCNAPRFDAMGRAHAFPHAIAQVWHMMGVVLSAAGSLQWYRETLAPRVPFEVLVAEAGSVEPGAEGVQFLPYLTGERTPHADPHARGAFVGLTTRHTRAHLTRAVLEGVAFALRDNLDLLGDAGLALPGEVRISGGGAKSGLWRQILADTLNVDLHRVKVVEGAALGAAVLAGVGLGLWSSADEACTRVVQTQEARTPGPDQERYAELHRRFTGLYPSLKPHF